MAKQKTMKDLKDIRSSLVEIRSSVKANNELTSLYLDVAVDALKKAVNSYYGEIL